MFRTKVVNNIKIHILFSVTLFFKNCALDEIMWKNAVQPTGTDDGMELAHSGACILHVGYARLQTHFRNT